MFPSPLKSSSLFLRPGNCFYAGVYFKSKFKFSPLIVKINKRSEGAEENHGRVVGVNAGMVNASPDRLESRLKAEKRKRQNAIRKSRDESSGSGSGGN